MLYYLAIIRDYLATKCNKKLYEEEKQKYEDLKTWTEKLILSNNELFNAFQECKNK
jgi:hypothetical protein